MTSATVTEMAELRCGLARMAPTAGNELLAVSGETEDTEASTGPAAFDPDEIPTLTEVVIPSLAYRAIRRDAGRTASR